MRVLFVCSVNRLRSPTAERVFGAWPGVEALSAGTEPSAIRPLSAELVSWADLIVAMEDHHREAVIQRYPRRPPDDRILALGIPDEFERDDPVLVRLLEDLAGPPIAAALRAAGG